MIPVVGALILKGGRLLAAKRPAGKHLAGKWEFPGGKIERGETPEEALRRELKEEMGIDTRCGRVYAAIPYEYPEKSVLLLFYAVSLEKGEPQGLEAQEIRWIGGEEMDRLDWAPVDALLVRRLKEDGLTFLESYLPRGR